MSQKFAEKVAAARARRADPTEEEVKEGLNTGVLAINPFSGENIPVWVANYVLMDYGTGAVMSVPAHDERDFEFAQKYSLPIRQVIAPVSHGQPAAEPISTTGTDQSAEMHQAFTEYGVLINSGEWGGKLSAVAIREMARYAEQHKFGGGAVTYRLRDWGVSRQRFWGAPVPIINCEKCGAVAVPYEDLAGRASGNGGVHRQRSIAIGRRAGVCEYNMSEVQTVRRAGKLTRWTRLSIRPGTSFVTAIRATTPRHLIRRSPPNGHRSISTLAATRTR